jgi:DNA-binding NarL/FixJ family response regulator
MSLHPWGKIRLLRQTFMLTPGEFVLVNVVICDERPMMRYAIGVLLEAEGDIKILGNAENVAAAVNLVGELRPEVLVAGLELGGDSPVALMEELAEKLPDSPTQVVAYTSLGDDQAIYDLLDTGARALLTEDSSKEELALAVRAAADGKAMLAPRLAYWLIERCLQSRLPSPVQPDDASLRALTPREREILVLTARGWSTEDIAAHLFISEATVRTHVYRLRSKLRLRDRAQVVSYAYRVGLVASD